LHTLSFENLLAHIANQTYMLVVAFFHWFAENYLQQSKAINWFHSAEIWLAVIKEVIASILKKSSHFAITALDFFEIVVPDKRRQQSKQSCSFVYHEPYLLF
jgi:hypothetical protein